MKNLSELQKPNYFEHCWLIPAGAIKTSMGDTIM